MIRQAGIMYLKDKIMQLISNIVHPHCGSNEEFVNYLRSTGTKIGKGTHFYAPSSVMIDDKRRSNITIGDFCSITYGCQLLCHDYSWIVLRRKYHEILPCPGFDIKIGNNVFLGWNTIVIGPVEIGDNVIVGAHSVVTHDLDSNCVYAGNPAKLICTIDEYYKKKKNNEFQNAKQQALHIAKVKGRKPSVEELGWFAVLFLKRNQESEDYLRTLSLKADDMNELINDFYSSEPMFNGFDSFLKACGLM